MSGIKYTPAPGAGGGGGALDNVVEDLTPQLGGQLDVNGFSLGDGTLELLSFIETASAVNEITVTNAATAGSPSLSATGGDAAIDLTLAAKGATGNVIITGNAIQLPASATPTVDANGEVAIDTTVADFSHGLIKYYSGEELACIAVPVAQLTTPTDGNVVAYNATNDEFELVPVVGSLINVTNSSGSGVVIGNVVYFDSSGDAIKAQADADATALGVGFATGTIADTVSGDFQVDGILEATTGEWNAVTEEGAGGLTEGARYFISEITAGKITTTAPSTAGETITQIGVALTDTKLKIMDTLTVKL